MPQDIRAGGAYVDLYTKHDKVAEGTGAVESALRQWGERISSIGGRLAITGAAVMAPLTAATKVFADSGAEMGEMASKLELPAEMLSVLDFAAKQTGTSLKELGTSADKWDKFVKNAGDTAGMSKLVARARELGVVMGTDDVKSAKAYKAAMEELSAVMKSVTFQLGGAVAPLITEASTRFATAAAAVIRFVRENQAMVSTAFRVAQVIAIVGASAWAAGHAIIFMGQASDGVITMMGILRGSVALLMSPIGLVAGALAGLAVYFFTATEQGKQAATAIGGALNIMAADAKDAVGSIQDALASGDLGLAAKIAWAFIQLEFRKGVASISATWQGWKAFFLNVWNDAVFGLADLFVAGWSGVQTAWTESIDFLADSWTVFTSFIMENWNTTIGFIKKWWLSLKSVFTDVDLEAEFKQIDNATENDNNANRQNAQDKIGARDKERRDAEQKNAANRDGARLILRQQQADEAAKIAAGVDDGVKEAQAQLNTAIVNFKALRQQAAKQRAAIPGKDAGKFDLPDLGKEKSGVLGTFNASVAGQIGGGTAMERTAKATEAMKKLLEQLNAKPGGIGFA